MSVIQEVANYLANESVGTIGETLFYSQIPDQDASFLIVVLDRIGPKPNVDILDIKIPMFQIFIRSNDYATGKAKLDRVRELLHGKTDTYLGSGSIYFRRIQAMSEGGHIGVNESNKDEFSINFMAEVVE